MNLIVPIADHTVIDAQLRPKWMWVHPNGNLMVAEALKCLNLTIFDTVYVGVLAHHVKKYNCLPGLEKQLIDIGIPKKKINIIVLSRNTHHQPETVAKILTKAAVKGPIFIKDADNSFEADIAPGNLVVVTNINTVKIPDPANKSYVMTDDNGFALNIVEKNILSSLFCSGGYGFSSAELYLKYYNKLKDKKNLFISHIIFRMLLDNIPFPTATTHSFTDWGNLKQWEAYRGSFMTVFIDLDGTLVHNSGQHFPPIWGETASLAENVATINALFDTGRVQVIITTSRKENFRKQTITQLKKYGIKYHHILFGMFHAQRVLVNDYSRSNPYKSCDAINIPRDSKNLSDFFLDYLQ